MKAGKKLLLEDIKDVNQSGFVARVVRQPPSGCYSPHERPAQTLVKSSATWSLAFLTRLGLLGGVAGVEAHSTIARRRVGNYYFEVDSRLVGELKE